MGDTPKNMVSNRFEPLICVGVTLLCLVPFLGKPFHVDDPLFVWVGDHIQKQPLNFYGFTVNWYGFESPMSDVTKNPPLACYYIAMAGSIFGFSEIALHGAFLIPAVVVVLGSYFLARQLCSRPLLAALAVIASPGFLVSATSVMCDVMMLAFWIWAIYFWMTGITRQNKVRLLISAVLVSLSMLTKYFGVSLLLLLPIYTLFQNRKMAWSLFFLLIPVLVILAYQWVTHRLYGRGLAGDAALYALDWDKQKSAAMTYRILVGLSFMGGCAAISLFMAPRLWSLRVILVFIAVVILLLTAAFKAVPVDYVRTVQVIAMAASGVSILALTASDCAGRRTAESVLLLLWVLGTFVFTAYVNWDVNARSILPMIPAAGILIARRLDRLAKYQSAGFWRLAWPIIPACLLALAVCRADYQAALAARTAAETIRQKYQNEPHLTFQGHWGFQYYMQRQGVKPLDFQTAIDSGVYIAVPENNTNIAEIPENGSVVEATLSFPVCSWLSTMDRNAGGGFYSAYAWGPMPFAFARTVPPDRYKIVLIK